MTRSDAEEILLRIQEARATTLKLCDHLEERTRQLRELAMNQQKVLEGILERVQKLERNLPYPILN